MVRSVCLGSLNRGEEGICSSWNFKGEPITLEQNSVQASAILSLTKWWRLQPEKYPLCLCGQWRFYRNGIHPRRSWLPSVTRVSTLARTEGLKLGFLKVRRTFPWKSSIDFQSCFVQPFLIELMVVILSADVSLQFITLLVINSL